MSGKGTEESKSIMMKELSARGQRYSFDGEYLTVREIHQRVPALSIQTVRNHLRSGRTTTVAMLSFSTEAIRAANGRRAAKRYKAKLI